MNNNEAESIAWELCKLKECWDSNIGKLDGSMAIANQGNELVLNILQSNAKIKLAFAHLYKSIED